MPCDEVTCQSAYQPVTELIRRHEREIWELKLQVEGETLVAVFETTDDHPWRTLRGEWLPTMELSPGMRILRAEGPPATVLSVRLTERIESTYNLEVAHFSTYFVGEAGVWVHNACKTTGQAFPDRKLPRDQHGRPVPETDAPHTQLGRQHGSRGQYPQAREFDSTGKPARDIDFTDHGRGHPDPHQHRYVPNPTGGTDKRGPPEPLGGS